MAALSSYSMQCANNCWIIPVRLSSNFFDTPRPRNSIYCVVGDVVIFLTLGLVTSWHRFQRLETNRLLALVRSKESAVKKKTQLSRSRLFTGATRHDAI